MQMFEYKCKNCGANLQLDLDNLQGCCQHCGSAVVIESAMLSQLLMEREKTKQLKDQHDHEERMIDKKNEADRRKNRAEIIKHFLKSDDAPMFVWVLSCFFFLILAFLILGFTSCIESCGNKVSSYDHYLPYSYEDVIGKKVEIVKKTFRNAGFGNITIVGSSNSNGFTLSEGEVVEVTINGCTDYKQGDHYKASPVLVITVFSPDGKFPFPYSNETAIGQSYHDIEAKLKELGYTNIQTSVREKSAFAFWDGTPSYRVVKMTVNGQEVFKVGDRFTLDVPIVLEYYN